METLGLKIKADYNADIYLACSWRSGAGQDIAWTLVRDLDQIKVRALGDVRDLPTQEEERITRIMQKCGGFVVILPFRNEHPSKTSAFIIDELRIAAQLKMPIALFYEKKVDVNVAVSGNSKVIAFNAESNQTDIVIASEHFFGPFMYDESNANLQDQVAGKLTTFIDSVIHHPRGTSPYAFLITRAQNNFELARNAIAAAVYNKAGIPCLWSGDGVHSTNINDTDLSAHLLIKHAEFVVADFTTDLKNPNPRMTLELGIAMAYHRPLLLFERGTRKEPFFAGEYLQMVFWEDERALHKIVGDTIQNRRAELGRRVFNLELFERDENYAAKISVPKFEIL